MDELKAELEAIKSRLTILETEDASIKAKIEGLETKLNTFISRQATLAALAVVIADAFLTRLGLIQ